MADYLLNIGKGRFRELFSRVDGSDPTNAVLVLVPLSASGTEAQGQDLGDLTSVLGDANFTELTANSWARVELDDTDLAATDYDDNDTDNRGDASIPETSLGSPTASTSTGLLLCYDSDNGAGTDANIEVLSHHDFAKTGDSSEILVAAGDVIQAS